MSQSLSKKNYTFDHEKTIYPNLTWKTALTRLGAVYPDPDYSFDIVKNTNNYTIINFSDGKLAQQGKGYSLDQAKASSIMEYIERLGIINYKFPTGCFKDSIKNLITDYDIDGLKNCFNLHFADNPAKTQKELSQIPVTWVKAFSLKYNKPTLYPFNFNHYYNSANGIASGNALPEAINHALCEIIEKHNTDYFFYNQRYKNPVILNPDSINSQIIKGILTQMKEENINITIYEASEPVNIPTFIVRGYDHNFKQEITAQAIGAGSHLNPEKALIKALTEYIQAKENINSKPELKCKKLTDNIQNIIHFDMIKEIETTKSLNFSDIESDSFDSFEEDNIELIKKCAEHADDIIYVSHTDQEIKIPVCRVYIPNFMTGTFIDAASRNEYWLIHRLIHESGNINEAQKYYEKNFKKMLNKSLPFLSMMYPDTDFSKIDHKRCQPALMAKMLKGIEINY